MPTMLCLLGTPHVVSPDGPATLGSPTATVLFAVLCANSNSPVSVEVLSEAVWGSRVPPTAAASLRGHMTRLRRRLDELGSSATIVPRRVGRSSGYELCVPDTDVDHLVFTTGLARISARQEPRIEDAVEVDRLLGLWTGDPLSGLDIDLLDPFVAHLAEAHVRAIETLARLLVTVDDPDSLRHVDTGTIALIERTSRQHPERERLAALAMHVLYRDGQQQQALELFQHTRRWLAEHLGLEPTAELVAMERAVLLQDPALAARPRASVGPARHGELTIVQPTSPFVGRTHELAEGLARLGAIDGGGASLLVTGPAGIGKSRLLTEISKQLRSDGVIVISGWCRPQTGWPFHAIEPLLECMGRAVPELAAACQIVLGAITEFEANASDSAGTERRRLARERGVIGALDGLITAIAEVRRPMVVCVEDLHWVDSSSLLVISHILRSSTPFLGLIASGRRDPDNRSWHSFLAELSTFPDLGHIALSGLERSALVQWLKAVAEHASEPDALVDALAAKTGGNPFFVQALLSDQDPLTHLTNARALPSLTPLIPSSVVDTLMARIDRLDERTRRELEIGAILGSTFDARHAMQVAEELGRPWQLDERRSIGIVRETSERAGGFAFDHDLLRDAVIAAMAATDRRLAHAAVARVGEQLGHPVEVTAYHLLAAYPEVDARTAINGAAEAARHAYQRLALEESAELFQAALDLLDTLPHPDPELEIELIIGLGLSAQRLGERSEFIPRFEAAMETAERLGSIDQMAAVGAAIAQFNSPVVSGERTEHLVERALRAGGGTIEQRALLAENLIFRWVQSHGAIPEAEALYHEIFDNVPDDAPLMVEIRQLQCQLIMATGWPEAEERLRLALELIDTAAALDGPASLLHVTDGQIFQLGALLELGRIDEAIDVLAKYRDAADALSDPATTWMGLSMEGDVALQLGRFAEAAELAVAAFEYGVAHGAEDATVYFYGHTAIAAMLTGEIADLLPIIEGPDLASLDLATIDAVLAVALVAAGETARARSILVSVVDRVVAEPVQLLRPIELMLAARACIGLGDAGLADRLLPLLEPYSGLMPRLAIVGPTLGPADGAIAGLLSVLGRDAEAEIFRRSATDLASTARFVADRRC